MCLCPCASVLYRSGFNRFSLEGFRVKTFGVCRVLKSPPNLQDCWRKLLRQGQRLSIGFGFRCLRPFALDGGSCCLGRHVPDLLLATILAVTGGLVAGAHRLSGWPMICKAPSFGHLCTPVVFGCRVLELHVNVKMYRHAARLSDRDERCMDPQSESVCTLGMCPGSRSEPVAMLFCWSSLGICLTVMDCLSSVSKLAS